MPCLTRKRSFRGVAVLRMRVDCRRDVAHARPCLRARLASQRAVRVPVARRHAQRVKYVLAACRYATIRHDEFYVWRTRCRMRPYPAARARHTPQVTVVIVRQTQSARPRLFHTNRRSPPALPCRRAFLLARYCLRFSPSLMFRSGFRTPRRHARYASIRVYTWVAWHTLSPPSARRRQQTPRHVR